MGPNVCCLLSQHDLGKDTKPSVADALTHLSAQGEEEGMSHGQLMAQPLVHSRGLIHVDSFCIFLFLRVEGETSS